MLSSSILNPMELRRDATHHRAGEYDTREEKKRKAFPEELQDPGGPGAWQALAPVGFVLAQLQAGPSPAPLIWADLPVFPWPFAPRLGRTRKCCVHHGDRGEVGLGRGQPRFTFPCSPCCTARRSTALGPRCSALPGRRGESTRRVSSVVWGGCPGPTPLIGRDRSVMGV